MTETRLPLEQRLRAVSLALCDALRGVVEGALSASGRVRSAELRPVDLTSGLGLDKSLASRVVRSLGATDPLRALLGIPTPQGLALIARAASERGATPAALEALETAAGAYADQLAEFSGGRTDLDATLAGWIPDQRARAERDARRSVFRGMTALSGTRASAVYNSVYLVPSSEAGRVDSLLVAVRQDVRRLREGARMLIASLAADPDAIDWRERRTALDGRPLAGAVDALVLEELCSHPVPRLEMDTSARHLQLSIASDSLDVNEFATVGFGWRTRGHFVGGGSAASRWSQMAFQTAWPTESLVVDLLVHRDLALPAPPVASLERGPSVESEPPAAPPPAGSWGRAAAPPVTDLEAHPSGLASPRVRSCRAIAESGCREAGFEAADFCAFRTTIDFPLASETLRLWWQHSGR